MISLWIKSIFGKLDIIVHVIASQLSGHCDITRRRLWCHQQNVNWTSEIRGRSVKISIFIVIYGFVMSCKKWNMYSRDELFMHSLQCYFGVYLSHCFPTREINTKITPSWLYKQFATRVHSLFYITLNQSTNNHVSAWSWKKVHALLNTAMSMAARNGRNLIYFETEQYLQHVKAELPPDKIISQCQPN